MRFQSRLPGARLRISFTGHRPHKIKDLREAENAITQFLVNSPSDVLVVTGGARGIDMMVAEKCVELGIDFIIILPFPFVVTTKYWPEEDKIRLERLMKKAFDVKVVSDHYCKGGYQKRNELLVDNGNILVSYWTGEKGGTLNTINYAKKKGIAVYNLGKYENQNT